MDRRILSFIFLGVGALAGLIGLWLAWSGWSYWRMAANLERAVERRFQGDLAASRDTAGSAADWYEHPAALVAAADLDSERADRSLARAARAADGRAHRRVATARAFAALLRGESQVDLGSLPTSDAALLAHLQDIRPYAGDRLPELPRLDDAPSHAVLRRVIEERLQRAWVLGDGRSLLADAGRLLSLDPRHPAREFCVLVQTWCQPHTDHSPMVQPLRRIGNSQQTAVYVRKLLELTERDRSLYGAAEERLAAVHAQRAVIAAKLIDDQLRTDEERALLQQQSGKRATAGLGRAVERAFETKAPGDVAKALQMAFEADQLQTVEKLLPLVPAEQSDRVKLALAEARWDLAALKAAGGDARAYLPQVRFIEKTDTRVNFHLVSDLGVLPPKAVRVSIDGTWLPADAIRRHGSAFSVTIPGGLLGVDIAIEMEGETLYTGRVVQR